MRTGRVTALLVLFAAVVLGTAPGPAQAATGRVMLTELRTHDGTGWFYATAPAEIDGAIHQYGMTDRRAVAPLQTTASAGTVPLYRLRTTAGHGYLLTSSATEITTLLDSGHFQYERILGYLGRSPGPGRQELDRMSNGTTWRVVTAGGQAALRRVGFGLDGPLGYTG